MLTMYDQIMSLHDIKSKTHMTYSIYHLQNILYISILTVGCESFIYMYVGIVLLEVQIEKRVCASKRH